jgi:hypothetical protein
MTSRTSERLLAEFEPAANQMAPRNVKQVPQLNRKEFCCRCRERALLQDYVLTCVWVSIAPNAISPLLSFPACMRFMRTCNETLPDKNVKFD